MAYDRTKFITRTPQESLCFDYMVAATDLIADKVFSPKPVDRATKKIYQYDLSKNRLVSTRSTTDSTPVLVDEQIFSSNIDLVEYKAGAKVNPRDVRDADLPSMLDEARKLKVVTQKLLMDRENIAAAYATNSANYVASCTSALAAGSRWDDAGGDPEADVYKTARPAVKNACGMVPNALAIDVLTLWTLKTSPSFRERVKYTQSNGIVPDEAIKAFFGVDYLFVAGGRYNSAQEGGTDNMANAFWGKNAILFVYNPGVGLDDVSFGLMPLINTPFWTKTVVQEEKTGMAGSMKMVMAGTEYGVYPGFVTSSGSQTFSAGYLFRTVIN